MSKRLIGPETDSEMTFSFAWYWSNCRHHHTVHRRICQFGIFVNNSQDPKTNPEFTNSRVPKLLILLLFFEYLVKKCFLFLLDLCKLAKKQYFQSFWNSRIVWILHWLLHREITLRDSLQKFITLRKARSLYLRLVQNACRNWAIALGVTPRGPKYAQEP